MSLDFANIALLYVLNNNISNHTINIEAFYFI